MEVADRPREGSVALTESSPAVPPIEAPVDPASALPPAGAGPAACALPPSGAGAAASPLPLHGGIADLPPAAAVRRILITSAWFGASVALVAWAFFGWRWVLGFVLGGLLGAANLHLLSVLARLVVVPGRKNLPSILAVLTIKILVIYGGLAGLLLWHLPPVLAVVCGFSLVLVVITLKAAGRALISGPLISGPWPRAGAGRTEKKST